MKITQKKTFFLPLLLINLIINPQQIQAKPTDSTPGIVKKTPFSSLQIPELADPDQPLGRRKGVASAPECPQALTNLTAIVPGKEGKSFLTSTTSEHATFWVYFPDVPNTIEYGEFILQKVSSNSKEDNPKTNIFRQKLALPTQSGFIGVSLPKLPQYAFKEGINYRWYFKVFCGNPEKSPSYSYVDATFKRVAKTPELTSQLEEQPNDYKVFAANQHWVDTLHSLGELHHQNSDNAIIQRDWIELLKVIDLGNIARTPIVEYYDFKQ
ncbi:MAG: DUF928 domain-containing protein [Cyanobacteria bacterium P01_D01_bin.50]